MKKIIVPGAILYHKIDKKLYIIENIDHTHITVSNVSGYLGFHNPLFPDWLDCLTLPNKLTLAYHSPR